MSVVNINNYQELIRTPNDDGTERIEIIGCKMIGGDGEIEANIVFPRVMEVEQAVLADENREIFTIHIPD